MTKNIKHNKIKSKDTKKIGRIEIINPLAKLIIDDDAYLEIIATGFTHADSPTWIQAEHLLLFTDIPNKKIHYWKEREGETKTYLEDINFAGQKTRTVELNSSNLFFNESGKATLLLFGQEKIAQMSAVIRDPKFKFDAWINNTQAYHLHTPSLFTTDAVNNIYFSDNSSTDNAIDNISYNIYRITPQYKLDLLLESKSTPKGITYATATDTLYITYTNEKSSYIQAYKSNQTTGKLEATKSFDFTPFIESNNDSPRGVHSDKFGNLFVAGLKGLWIFNKDLKLISRVYFPEPATNCALASDCKEVYITTEKQILRLKLRNN